MKSIKEKTEEYANEQELRMVCNGSCDNCRQGFVVGANYVLEEIENILSLEYNAMATVDLIVEKVKELKGE